MNITEKDLKRFWSKVGEPNENGCRLWTACTNSWGYGLFVYCGKLWLTHRFSYLLSHKQDMDYIPEGLLVCHTCDIPSCVTDEHLWLGTNQDNIIDMFNKGRGHIPDFHGVNNNMSKLTNKDILDIRNRYATGEVTQQELADSFGVHQTNIHYIVKYKTWENIKEY